MSTATALAPSKLRLGDLARLASVGLRTRRVRAALSALGIAIGVAAIAGVYALALVGYEAADALEGEVTAARAASHW